MPSTALGRLVGKVQPAARFSSSPFLAAMLVAGAAIAAQNPGFPAPPRRTSFRSPAAARHADRRRERHHPVRERMPTS